MNNDKAELQTKLKEIVLNILPGSLNQESINALANRYNFSAYLLEQALIGDYTLISYGTLNKMMECLENIEPLELMVLEEFNLSQ